MRRLIAALSSIIGYQKNIVLSAIIGLMALPCYALPSEASLQTAFVYNFIKFIDWPSAESATSLRLCVLGANKEMREALQQLDGKAVNKKVIEIVYFNSDTTVTTAIESCHMAYQPGRSNFSLPQPFPKGVVLVANDPDQENLDVSIALLRNREGRIEFSINQAAVSHSGVRMSSQLLKLAINTHGGRD
ncbi:MAG: YfiR family protein [Pseudomonadota bacterium]